MSKFRKILGASAVLAAALLSGTAAQAVPFVSGTFGINTNINPNLGGNLTGSNSTLVTTSTVFFNASANLTTGFGTGSFSIISSGDLLPLNNAPTNTLDLSDATTFSTVLPDNAGTFVGTLITNIVPTTSGNHGTLSWDVIGTYTTGSAFNALVVGAEETWTCNQTGPGSVPAGAITCSGTFAAPFVNAPEPLTISLFGAGLLGAAAARRRRKAALVA